MLRTDHQALDIVRREGAARLTLGHVAVVGRLAVAHVHCAIDTDGVWQAEGATAMLRGHCSETEAAQTFAVLMRGGLRAA
jgi:hypothetical protein